MFRSLVLYVRDSLITETQNPETLVYVTEQQHHISIFLTRLWWSVYISMLSKYAESWNQDSQLRMRLYTKSNDKQKWSEDRKENLLAFVGSLPLYLNNIEMRTDHKRVKKVEK